MTQTKGRPGLKKKWGPVVNCIADLLGVRAEVLLHDVSHPDGSVIMIRNGHVTGRTVGAPLTDLGFYMLREPDHQIETLGVYHSKTDDGKPLKCNAANLRDQHGKIEAILCINIDTSENENVGFGQGSFQLTEHYPTNINQVIRNMIAKASGNGSVSTLTRDQQFNVVRALDAQGAFFARGSVKQVSSALKIAVPTVYKYIAKTRRDGIGPNKKPNRQNVRNAKTKTDPRRSSMLEKRH
jgi:predicted transcriptional regulator YheO